MKLKTPINKQDIVNMKAGDIIYFSGVIYTGRDSAHKKMTEALSQGLELPIDFDGQVIYYTGPTPDKPGRPIGSCGTT